MYLCPLFVNVKVLPGHFYAGWIFPFFLSSQFFLCFSAGKVFIPKQKPIETRQEEVTTLDPELEEALSSATDTELCDLAGKSGWVPFRGGFHKTLCRPLRFVHPDLVTPHSLTGAFLNLNEQSVVCFSLQPSWVFTRWSPAVKHTTAPQAKRVTTVSGIRELKVLIQKSWKELHFDPVLCLIPRCDQRGEDEPSVWWTSQSHQRRRDSAEDKKQWRLLNGGQPQQY